MKKLLLILTIPMLLIMFVSILSCDSDEAKKKALLELFSLATEEVAPHFMGSRMGFGTDQLRWYPGNAVYEIYGILNAAGDSYGYFNLHQQMDSADQAFTDGVNGGTPAAGSTAGALPSPFEQSLVDTASMAFETRYGSENTQILIANSTENKLMAYANYNLGDQGSKQMEAVKAAYNETSGDLELITVKMNDVTYETPARLEFCKVYLKGNANSHQFLIKLTLHDVNSDSSSAMERGKLVGYGISEGENNYFLIKVINTTSTRYIKFVANSNKADLQAMVEAATTELGYADAEVTSAVDPQGYKAHIDAVNTSDSFYDWSAVPSTAGNYNTYHNWAASDLLKLF